MKLKKLRRLSIFLMRMGKFYNKILRGGEIDPRELKTVMASLGFATDE